MRHLVILVTKSDFDRGELRKIDKFPDEYIVYIECEQGRVSKEPISESSRLLAVVLMENFKTNTENVSTVLQNYSGYEAVIGTHGVEPKNALDTDSLKSSMIKNFRKYSTAWPGWGFLSTWCKDPTKNAPGNFDKLFELLRKPDALSVIRRIAHLWWSLEIDLQGIEEVKGKKINGEDGQVKYLKEVLGEKSDGIYCQKLANLRYAITGNEGDRGGDGVPTADDFKNLIQQSLADIIPENKRKQEWEILLELAGLKGDKPKYITEFMKMLDRKISEANVSLDDVSDVLDFFKSKDWKIEGANPKAIKSFHDWFCALDDCLDKLRGNL